MSRCSQSFKTVVVVPCLLFALAFLCATPARAEIFARIGSGPAAIMGGVGGAGDEVFRSWKGWTRLTSLQLGGQIVPANAPWHVTAPPGPGKITLTKNTDVSTAGLSAAFAGSRDLRTVMIDLVWLDARGVVTKVDEYRLSEAVLSSFNATPPTETLVVDFASMVSVPGHIPPSPLPDAARETRKRSGGTRTLATRTP